MTVSTTNTRAELNGNGSAGPFQCGFRVLADSDLQVYVDGVLKTLTTHYTVANAGTTTNATVTFTSGNFPASGTANVVLVRNVPNTQTSDYQNNTALDAETLETSFDRGTMQIQQLSSGTDRALKFDDTVTGVTSSVTDISTGATSRANKILGFDASGNVSATLELGTNRGNWATSTAYVVRDIVKQNVSSQTSTYGNIYLCLETHSSTGSYLTENDSDKWQLIFDIATSTTNATTSTTQASLASDHRADAGKYAVTAEDSTFTLTSTNGGTSGLYSALHYQAKAQANQTAAASSASTATTKASEASASATAAAASAAAVATALDSFDDKYLGVMADNATQGTNPTTNGTWAKNASAITVASGANIKVGQVVTGTGMPSPPPNVLSVTGSGSNETVVVSENMAAAGSSVALTFTGYGVYGTFNSTKDGPATDNDNGTLANGALYFNSTDGEMRVYDTSSGAWIAASAAQNATVLDYTYTLSGSDSTISGADDNSATLSFGSQESVDVFLNGVKLVPKIGSDANDYHLDTSNTVTLTSTAVSGDVILVRVYKTFTVADAVPASTGGTFSGNVAYTGNIQVDDIVEKTSAHGVEIDGVTLKDGGGTFTGNVVIPDGGTIGSASDTDAIAIASDGGLTFSGGIDNAGTISAGSVASAVTFTRPAFLVQASAQTNVGNPLGTDTKLNYDTVIKNEGGGTFSSNTYTAPVSGLYQINATTYFSQYPNNITSVRMKIVARRGTSAHRTIRKHFGEYLNAEHTSSYSQSFTISSLIDLDANDTVYIAYNQTGGSAAADLNATDSYFSGFLVCNY